MHRNGILKNEIDEAFQIIKQKKLILNAIFTHFASADSLSAHFFVQQKNWIEIKKYITDNYSSYKLLFHSANSSTTFRVNNYEDDFARIGLASYGYIYLNNKTNLFNLKPVMSVWANKTSSRKLTKGQKVGYSNLYTLKENMVVSTYDIGYSDGLNWSDTTKEFHLPNNNKILGKVSMDYISVNTDEDEILIFDDASHFARRFNTIIYDILVKMGEKSC